MAQPGKYISIFIPEELLKQIESFRYSERIPSRVQAMRELMAKGVPRHLRVKASES